MRYFDSQHPNVPPPRLRKRKQRAAVKAATPAEVAEAFLRERLEGKGWMTSAAVTREARERGISNRALTDARRTLGVTARYDEGVWFMKLVRRKRGREDPANRGDWP